jgi:hypothetical protein
MEPIEQDRQQLLDLVAKVDHRARILAAVVRALLALLRASGFTLVGGQGCLFQLDDRSVLSAR